jgi:hypothetical protein
MSIIEKSDVERHRRDINLCRPVSQPDATGFSVAEPQEIKPNPSAFSDDYSREHAIPGKSVTPIGFIGTQAPCVEINTRVKRHSVLLCERPILPAGLHTRLARGSWLE